MANKNLTHAAIYRYEPDTNRWIPFNPDIDVNGALVVSSYAANPVHVAIDSGGTTMYAEDAAHVSGDQGIQSLAVRTDTPTNRSGTDGDYEPLQITGGRLHVADTRTGASSQQIQGAGADGAAVVGNPVRIGIDAGNGNLIDFPVASPGFGANSFIPVTTIKNSGSSWRVPSTPAAMGDSGDYDDHAMMAGIALFGGGTTLNRLRNITNATDSTGTGILPAGLLAQFDDTAPTAITENQFGNLRMSSNRNLYATLRDAAGNERGANVDSNNTLLVTPNSLTMTTTDNLGQNIDVMLVKNTGTSALYFIAMMHYLNTTTGTSLTWDRGRGIWQSTVLASAARTGDTTSATQTAYNHKGIVLFLNVSAVGAPAGQIDTLNIQAEDPGSGNWFTMYAFTALAINSTGQRAFLIYPGAASPASWTQAPIQGVIPRQWRINVDHANQTDSITYSVMICAQL